MRDGVAIVPLGEVARLDIEKVPVVPGTTYQIAGVLNAGQGILAARPDRRCTRPTIRPCTGSEPVSW